jgi:hypothetical protein
MNWNIALDIATLRFVNTPTDPGSYGDIIDVVRAGEMKLAKIRSCDSRLRPETSSLNLAITKLF